VRVLGQEKIVAAPVVKLVRRFSAYVNVALYFATTAFIRPHEHSAWLSKYFVQNNAIDLAFNRGVETFHRF